jgi:hypothetical protein
MSRIAAEIPAQFPILSRGRHRSPRKGACFMEMAGFLAGERWSDHPACTHPLLAELARLVNDHISDDNRSRLIELIPSVVGLTPEDERVDARVALICARTALPLVSADRQNVMAIGIFAAERVLARLDGAEPGRLLQESRDALEQVPLAAEWAARFACNVGFTVRGFRRHSAPTIVRSAVRGIAEACIPDPDRVLHDLLVAAIAECAAAADPSPGNDVTDQPGVHVRVPAASRVVSESWPLRPLE